MVIDFLCHFVIILIKVTPLLFIRNPIAWLIEIRARLWVFFYAYLHWLLCYLIMSDEDNQ